MSNCRARAAAGTIGGMVAVPGLRVAACALVVAAGLAAATHAVADDGSRTEVRVRASCTGSTVSSLRVRAEDGRLRVDFRIEPDRRYAAWSIVILRERRLVFQGTVRPARGRREVEFRRSVAAWPGTNTVVVRASTRTGQSCRATTTV